MSDHMGKAYWSPAAQPSDSPLIVHVEHLDDEITSILPPSIVAVTARSIAMDSRLEIELHD